MSEITPEGERLVSAWEAARQRVERAESELNGARCDANNTERALGKWLLPNDAKPGEQFAVWHDKLLYVASIQTFNGDPKVTIRERGNT